MTHSNLLDNDLSLITIQFLVISMCRTCCSIMRKGYVMHPIFVVIYLLNGDMSHLFWISMMIAIRGVIVFGTRSVRFSLERVVFLSVFVDVSWGKRYIVISSIIEMVLFCFSLIGRICMIGSSGLCWLLGLKLEFGLQLQYLFLKHQLLDL